MNKENWQEIKEGLQIAFVALFLLVGVVFIIWGFVYLYNTKQAGYSKEANATCKQITELVNVKKYEVDENFNCLFVKDGQLQRIKD